MKERCLFTVFAVALADSFNDIAGFNVFMDMEGNGWNFKGGVLCLTCPNSWG